VQTSGLTHSSGKKLPTLYGFVDHQAKLAIAPQFMPAGEFLDDPGWVYFDRAGNRDPNPQSASPRESRPVR